MIFFKLSVYNFTICILKVNDIYYILPYFFIKTYFIKKYVKFDLIKIVKFVIM